MPREPRGKWTRYVRAIGIEVECGTNDRDAVEAICQRYGADIGYDGSVSVPCEHSGIEIKRKFNVWTEMGMFRKFIKELFPLIKQNSTCGNHFHICLKNEATPMMASKEFVTRFLKNYREQYAGNSKYLGRLTNHYCSGRISERTIVEQLKYSQRRYTAVNACAWRKHRTIEFRLMPWAESADEYLAAAEWVIDQVEKLIPAIRRFYATRVPLLINSQWAESDRTVSIGDQPALSREVAIACAS